MRPLGENWFKKFNCSKLRLFKRNFQNWHILSKHYYTGLHSNNLEMLLFLILEKSVGAACCAASKSHKSSVFFFLLIPPVSSALQLMWLAIKVRVTVTWWILTVLLRTSRPTADNTNYDSEGQTFFLSHTQNANSEKANLLPSKIQNHGSHEQVL